MTYMPDDGHIYVVDIRHAMSYPRKLAHLYDLLDDWYFVILLFVTHDLRFRGNGF